MRSVLFISSLLWAAFSLAGCGDSTSGADMAGMCSGGPLNGAQDMHCVSDGGLQLISADPTQCNAPASGGGGADYGDTMYNASGYDDDCKYLVSFTATPICSVDPSTTFTVTLTDAVTGKPITGAAANGNMVRLEVFLDATHPANVSGVTTTESAPGVYTLGQLAFPSSGKWTVRFHFFENCTDLPASPHGHAAFYLEVP